ncbi:hypothetical protein LJ656_08200 [Paraburkholderia sp. MMS20-SJTR3]|uniref:Uncharacterized protein n=1 Tax=Paraburkholderia sejongensis TaxID=2886946 RepID=A0ABS8JRN5_9BURK|nr:hypothetical protein [Paraburkholderia sp. MMS20-SJTR3]MCC8392566.1 hypothetical protein [Paraburkholderia sp. MMS20-SJTR3]
MKMSHKLRSSPAGPAWGLLLGLVLTVAGVGLWFHAHAALDPAEDVLAVAALLAGVFVLVYSARELHRSSRAARMHR